MTPDEPDEIERTPTRPIVTPAPREGLRPPVPLPLPRDVVWSIVGAVIVFAVALAAIAWGVWGLLS